MSDIECDGDGNEDGGRNGDDMIKTKHYLNNIIEMISKLSNVIAITTTWLVMPHFTNFNNLFEIPSTPVLVLGF